MVSFMKKYKKIIVHSLKSLKYNFKNYMRILAVVIVTFTIILVVLGFRDSVFFNDHKHIKVLPKDLVMVELNALEKESTQVQSFLSSMKNLKDVEQTMYIHSSSNYASNYYQNKVGGFLTFHPYYVDDTFIHLPIYLGSKYEKLKLKDGRTFTSYDKYQDKIVIINEITAEILFPHSSPINEYIHIYTRFGVEEKFRIVGVLEATQFDYECYQEYLDTNHYSTPVYVPRNDMVLDEACDNFTYCFKTTNTTEVQKLRDTFQMNHVTITNVEHNRYARNQYDNFISNVIILFIISLVMVINIQGIFKTVLYTRRKEIGIRRSLGATKFDIFLQFLIECFVILIICIILATILSINILYIMIYLMKDTYLNMSIYFSAYTIIAFFGMAILQCISLSLSTALNAVNVDIIQLLNYE